MIVYRCISSFAASNSYNLEITNNFCFETLNVIFTFAVTIVQLRISFYWLVLLFSHTLFYYMAVSHKDWELPNSRIWSAEINIESRLDQHLDWHLDW